MNKTIYLPDEEAETWEKARRLANDRLSPVILQALKAFIMKKDAEAAEATGFERIEVSFDDVDDNGLPKKKAFHGRWIFSPKKPLHYWSEDGADADYYCVAVTAKNNIVMYTWHESRENEDHFITHKRFRVYPSLSQAAEDPSVNVAAREARKQLGIPVEELDI